MFEGLTFNYKGKKEKIDSLAKAKTFLELQQTPAKPIRETLDNNATDESEEKASSGSSYSTSVSLGDFMDSESELGEAAPRSYKVKLPVKKKKKQNQKKKPKLREELSEANEQSTTLQRELEKLNEEESRLEEILNEKKAARKIVERHSEEREAEMKRQQKLNLESKERTEELEAKIQEEKLKQRKQRMEFEQRLEELMEKHRSLWECYVRKKPMTEADKEVLLAKEKLIQEKLARVQDELDLLRCSPFNEERRFLKSPAAACAMELFQEEYKKATEYLETTTKENSDLQERCRRLKAELENLGVQDGCPKED
ncbi:PREDICTED: LOW QUALITY PROTEIN: synaptonemal complex central element protein 1 [Gekko japonicus]|uniref:LOW QUALITY PROTEIN: synaptonemal complex central element protein 1 n=1 Tax=Gekko japonicus TaxID=146911 RepID=A0ABM1JJJ5_GEKJA|nr:PREDICTED: LOW QUALITY PROTEIN: synaptonemal complex central element protein 1 [Gekko japonicus]